MHCFQLLLRSCIFFFNQQGRRVLDIVFGLGFASASAGTTAEEPLVEQRGHTDVEKGGDEHEYESGEGEERGVVQDVPVELPLGQLGEMREFVPVLGGQLEARGHGQDGLVEVDEDGLDKLVVADPVGVGVVVDADELDGVPAEIVQLPDHVAHVRRQTLHRHLVVVHVLVLVLFAVLF